jgi:Ku70/Ku80 C-terminal arm
LIYFSVEQVVTSHAVFSIVVSISLCGQPSFPYCSFITFLLFVALQRHYGALQVFALGEDEIPDIKDETLPDEEGLSR